jgi:hypothetical protein
MADNNPNLMTMGNVFYFDTSAVNSLHDDPHVSDIKNAVKQFAQVLVSVFTVAELASTSDPDRRVALLKTAKTISGEYRPVAMPGELLKRSLEAVSIWARDMEQSMGSEWDGVWIALNDPNLIDRESYLEITQWKAQQERWYHEMHERGRTLMQQTLDRLPAEERHELLSRFSRLIKYYRPDREFVQDTVSYIASRSGTTIPVDRALAYRIIKHSEHWRFFLASMAYGMYGRSIRTTHFGKNSNPGSIDTQQSIYLAICDVFVTADQLQYDMLRLIASFGHKKRHIWKYPRFVSWLMDQSKDY